MSIATPPELTTYFTTFVCLQGVQRHWRRWVQVVPCRRFCSGPRLGPWRGLCLRIRDQLRQFIQPRLWRLQRPGGPVHRGCHLPRRSWHPFSIGEVWTQKHISIFSAVHNNIMISWTLWRDTRKSYDQSTPWWEGSLICTHRQIILCQTLGENEVLCDIPVSWVALTWPWKSPAPTTSSQLFWRVTRLRSSPSA